MPFEHSCFISYRHPNHQLGCRIVNELYEGLCSELELMTDKDVYLDIEGLEGGLVPRLCRMQRLPMLLVVTAG